MSEINWALIANPVDTGAQVQQGFATGMAMVKQIQSRNALRAYLQAPDDPQAYNALAAFDPAAAATLQAQRQNELAYNTKLGDLETRRTVGGLAATGDVAGARSAALAGGDFDLAETLNKMSEAERKATLDKYTGTAPIAYQASKLPYEQRKTFLAAAAPELKALGWTDDQIAGFDPTNANIAGIVGVGSKLSELVAADKPQIVPFTAGGGIGAYQNGEIHLLVAPNPGDKAAGSPVTAAPSGNGPAANNPGALRVPGSTKFQSFATPQEGVAAQEALLGRYMARGLNNVASIVETYAPRQSKGGDNTDAQVNNYIGYVAKRLGVNPQDTLPPAMVPKLAEAMREFETGHRAAAVASAHSPDAILAAAHRAIAAGADPEAVRARAAAQGVTL